MDISPELKSQCSDAMELAINKKQAEAVQQIKSICDTNKSSWYPYYCGASIMRLDTNTAGDAFEFSLKAVEMWEKPSKPKELEDENEEYRLYSVHATSSYQWLKKLLPSNDDEREKAAEAVVVGCEKVLFLLQKTQEKENEKKMMKNWIAECTNIVDDIRRRNAIIADLLDDDAPKKKKKKKKKKKGDAALAIEAVEAPNEPFGDKEDEVKAVEASDEPDGDKEDEVKAVEASDEPDGDKEDEGKSVPFTNIAEIRYNVDSQWKCKGVGVAWLSDTPEPISVEFFLTEEDAINHYNLLRKFKNPRIVEAICRKDKQVVIEQIYMDIEDWVEQKHQAFVSLESKDTQISWWDFIGPTFIPIFRDVLKALLFLYQNGAHCGDLKNSISVVNRSSAKLCGIRIPRVAGDLAFRAIRDIKQLVELMKSILARPYKEGPEFNLSQMKLEDIAMPKALRFFMSSLDSKESVSSDWEIWWLLDEAFFWSDVEKLSFLRKVYDTKYRFENKPDLNTIMAALLGGSTELESFIPKGGVEERVYMFGLEQQKSKKAEMDRLGLEYFPPYHNIFIGVFLYTRNLIAHYNHHNPLDARVKLADDLFGGACSFIRHALADFRLRYPNWLQRIDFYLSKEPY